MAPNPACLFCGIIQRQVEAAIVFEDPVSIAFLDHRPVFKGHCLLVPKRHLETFGELAADHLGPLFANAQRLSQAVESALGAGGAFIAINNKISQSVPHLHIHVIPRTKGDGLRGFFWPRSKYAQGEVQDYAERLRNSLSNP